jgi:hypothetical protein
VSVRDLMPADWDDRAGWETYYAAYRDEKRHLDNMEMAFDWRTTSGFLQSIIEQPTMKIWFPGCGASIAPHVFAAVGFEVWATDFSQAAIEIQTALRDLPLADHLPIDDLKAQRPPDAREGSLRIARHDFREPMDEARFDLIVNVKSFQALHQASMEAAARVHYQALLPGGQALFATMNVQGEQRDRIETILVQAGFLVPYYQTNTWYRKTLDDTGIPYIDILGVPRPWHQDPRYQGPDREERLEADQKILAGYQQEYRQRLEQEHEATQAFLDTADDVRIATVIYNTG